MSKRKEPICYGIIGTGIWGQLHARIMSGDPRVMLHAVCDVDEKKAREVAGQFDIPKVYQDYHEMLADPAIEAVSVATPDFAHTEPALAVINSGHHLLVEKPMTTKVEDGLAIVKAAKTSGKKVMVDFHTRWSPSFFNAYECLRSGELGQLKLVSFRLSDTIYVPTRYISWGSKSSVLWFLGPHVVDTLRWLFGAEVNKVYAVCRKGLLTSMGIDTPDFYTLILQFEGGGVAQVEHSWIVSSNTPNLVDGKCELEGTEGTIFIDISSHRMFEKYNKLTPQGYPNTPMQDVALMPITQGKQIGYAAESIRAFIDCVWNDTTPLCTEIDGLRATEVLEAAERSADTDLPVKVVRNVV